MPLPAAPRAFLLDFDGIVLATTELKLNAVAALYDDCGAAAQAAIRTFQRHHGGVTRAKLFARIEAEVLNRPVDEARVARLVERFAASVHDRVMAAPFVPGAEAFLHAACARAPVFVVSGTPEAELRAIVSGRSLGGFFRGLFGAPWLKRDAFASILDDTGFAAADTLAVGDAVTECEAALSLGIPFIGVAPLTDPGFPTGVPVVADMAAAGRLIGLLPA